MSAHAMLSASGAERWLHCPPSARLEQQFPDTASDYAREGTLAHEIAALKLRRHFHPASMTKQAFTRDMNRLKKLPLYQDEMQRHTDAYLECVQEAAMRFDTAPLAVIERRVDYSAYVPEGFGTSDCFLIAPHVLHVFDFKYGQGVPVSAEDNAQMKLYALGAWLLYQPLFNIREVRMTIAQPRLDSVSTWSLPIAGLLAWAESIRPTAQQAYDGEGAQAAGAWCRFCRAKAQCRARAAQILTLESYNCKPSELLTDAEIGDVLARAKLLTGWANDVEDYALSAVLAGREIPGWKAVEGRSVRQFTDTDAAFNAAMDAGVDKALLYEYKPLTLAQTEKVIGKRDFETILGSYVTRQPGKPTLVPETDNREAIKTTLSAADAFGA